MGPARCRSPKNGSAGREREGRREREREREAGVGEGEEAVGEAWAKWGQLEHRAQGRYCNDQVGSE